MQHPQDPIPPDPRIPYTYGQYPPPQLPLTRPTKPKRWPWIVAVLVAFFVGFSAGHSSGDTTTTSSTNTQQSFISQAQQSTPVPTKPPKPQVWTTVQTFTGNGSKKTGTFPAPNDWKITWKCNPASFEGMSYNMIIDVDNSDGSAADLGAVNAMCKAGSISGESEEHGISGQVYLNVTSEGDWTISVQVLK